MSEGGVCWRGVAIGRCGNQWGARGAGLRTEGKLSLRLDVIPISDYFSLDKSKEGDSGVWCDHFAHLSQRLL